MTCAYVPVIDLSIGEIRGFLADNNCDMTDIPDEHLKNLTLLFAQYFDEHVAPRSLVNRLNERIQM